MWFPSRYPLYSISYTSSRESNLCLYLCPTCMASGLRGTSNTQMIEPLRELESRPLSLM